jgi:hypothetical protein
VLGASPIEEQQKELRQKTEGIPKVNFLDFGDQVQCSSETKGKDSIKSFSKERQLAEGLTLSVPIRDNDDLKPIPLLEIPKFTHHPPRGSANWSFCAWEIGAFIAKILEGGSPSPIVWAKL